MFATHPQFPVRRQTLRIVQEGRFFTHADARRMVTQTVNQGARQILIDLRSADDATTSAFAELVLLRRSLLRSGRDLCLTGLRDRTAGVFQVNRLETILPTA